MILNKNAPNFFNVKILPLFRSLVHFIILNTDKERHNSWQKPKQKQNQKQNQRRNKKI